MLHESIISRTASSEIPQMDNVEKVNLSSKLEEILDDIKVVEKPIPYTLETITIAKDNDIYYVDFESLMNYMNTNNETVYDTFKKLEDLYDIDKDDMYLVLPCKEKLMHAMKEIDCSTSIDKHRCANSVAKTLILIDNIKKEGINMVISDY